MGTDSDEAVVADALRATEHRRLAALTAKDGPVARSLHAPDYELITPGGGRISGDEYLEGVLSGALDYQVFEADGDIRVRLHGSVAVLRYVARIEMRMADGVDADRFWHTDVYELRDGRWLAVWSHATRIRST
ncbi:MAG TPA: nuclear transport factor 2 family protein [Candidatus Limnocylindrales bacterium]|nr:nuclear transport factor 2 family protein [Candidatus Limnocylindrales bacterium]